MPVRSQPQGESISSLQPTRSARSGPFAFRSWGQSLRAALAAEPGCWTGTTLSIATRCMLLLAILSVGGCYSEFPADSTPQIPVDRSLLGTWWCSSDSPAQLKVRAKDQFWYEVTASEPKQKTERYLGYASSIGGRTVINLKAKPPAPSGWDHPWTFVVIDVSNGVLHRQVIEDGVLSGKERSAEEVRTSLEKALISGKGLGEDGPCSRSKGAVQ